MSKPIKYCVALVVKDKRRPDNFLIVKRPDADPDLAGSWGLPAGTSKDGETPETVADRICRDKLGCTATPTRLLGVMFQKRNSYDMFLMDIEVELQSGQKPDVTKSTTALTAYIEQKWSDDPMELMPSANHGSCCASIFLTDRGLLDRDEWIASLEGSVTVA